jgi:hypothetical protein
MRLDTGPAHLLGNLAPPGATLHCERDLLNSLEAAQPQRQVLPVGRRDPTPLQPAGFRIDVVERQLLPVNVHTT